MAIRVVKNKPQAKRATVAQMMDMKEATIIPPEQVWDRLTHLQQRQVVRSLVHVGRQLVQQAMSQGTEDEHL
jgi:hypothetical protein